MMYASLRPFGTRLRGKPHTKLRCLNVTPSQWMIGPNGATNSGTANWWATFNWVGHFKPQIDLAIAAGCNAVKLLIMGPGITIPVEDPPGDTYPDSATLYTRFRGVLDYCRLKDLAVYISALQGANYLFGVNGDAQKSQRLAAFQTMCGWCEKIPSSPVCAIDVCNEVNYYRPSSWESAAASSQPNMVADLTTLATLARQVTSIPLTISVNMENAGEWSSDLMRLVAPLVDFHDVHLYYGFTSGALTSAVPLLSDASGLFTAPWYRGSWICGEVGVPYQNLTTAYNDAYAQNWISGCAPLIGHSDCWGFNYWAASDCQEDSVAQNFGIADKWFRNPRAGRIAGLQALPSF